VFFQVTIIEYLGTPRIGRTICTSITIYDKFRLPIRVAAITVAVHICASCVLFPEWIRLLMVIWMQRVQYRLHAPVLTSSTWTLEITRPAYPTVPLVSMNARKTIKSVFHGFGSAFEQKYFLFIQSLC